MSLYNSFDRNKHFSELGNPLDTAEGVLSPAVRRARARANLMTESALPTGAAITTGATTALGFHNMISPVSGLIKLDFTSFAVGTASDGASLGIGASVLSFPTETWVIGRYLAGTFTLVADDGMAGVALEAGLGTTVASGAVSVLGGTAAFENVLGGTASAVGVDGGDPGPTTFAFVAPVLSVNAAGGQGVVLRTTTPGLAVFLNAAAAWNAAMDANAALTFTGSMVVEYLYAA